MCITNVETAPYYGMTGRSFLYMGFCSARGFVWIIIEPVAWRCDGWAATTFRAFVSLQFDVSGYHQLGLAIRVGCTERLSQRAQLHVQSGGAVGG